jgi:hypothetical protein
LDVVVRAIRPGLAVSLVLVAVYLALAVTVTPRIY